MYQFHSLQETDLQQLADCFNLAFSDYEQPMHFTPESLQYYLTASAVDLSLSFGAFLDGVPVGFILNSGGIYNHQPVVFDAGTGVVPRHQGRKVFSMLFDHTVRQLRDRGIAKYYLEVLQSNDHAISIYRKNGFSVLREFTVLAASGAAYAPSDRVRVIPYGDFTAFATAFTVAPSFEHTSHTIDLNPQLHEVLCLEGGAYCIYAKRNGAIKQMHYNDLAALKEVITTLIHRYPSLWAKNVDRGCTDVIQILTDLGFSEITKQYEMVRDI